MFGEDAGSDPLKEIERQVEHMPKGSGGDPQIDLIGGMQQQVIAQENRDSR